jgi:hypothetical protein
MNTSCLQRTLSSVAIGVLLMVVGDGRLWAVDLKVSRLKVGPSPAAVGEVKMYRLEKPPGRPYEVLGVVSAVGNRLSARSGKTIKLMQSEAAAMGAEALVAYYYDDEKNTTTEAWAGALAVKFLPPGSAGQPVPVPCVVVVPRFAKPEELAQNKKARRTEEAARKWARFLLARKGYYAFLTDDVFPGVTGPPLNELLNEKRLQFGRPEADRILELRFLDKTGVSIGLLTTEYNHLAALLHSKTGGTAALWTSSAGAATTVGGLADVFVPSAKTIESVRWALESAFKRLPDLSTPSPSK